MNPAQSSKRRKNRGRPKSGDLDKCQRIYWAWKVKEILNLDFAKIERLLYPDCATQRDDEGGYRQPQLFLKYSKGIHSPIGNGRSNLSKTPALELAEVHAPGSKSVYQSILWQLLKRRKLTAIDAKAFCGKIDVNVGRRLLEILPHCHTNYEAIKSLEIEVLNELAEIQHIDVLAILLMHMRLRPYAFCYQASEAILKWFSMMTENDTAFPLADGSR